MYCMYASQLFVMTDQKYISLASVIKINLFIIKYALASSYFSMLFTAIINLLAKPRNKRRLFIHV